MEATYTIVSAVFRNKQTMSHPNNQAQDLTARCIIFLAAILYFSFPCPCAAQLAIRTLSYSPVNDSAIATGGVGNSISLWNLQNESKITLRGHRDTVNSVAYSPNGKTLASGGDDWTLRLWDTTRGENTATLKHVVDRTKYAVTAVAFSPDGQILATAAIHIKLWNLRNQAEIATLRRDNYVRALDFSSDGRFLAAGDQGGPRNVKVWDVSTRQAVASMQADSKAVYSVVFSPDDRLLASAGYDGIIKLWTVSDWNLQGTLHSPGGTVYSLDIAPDGKALASTGHESVSLWAVESGEKIASLSLGSGWVRAVAFSNDGNQLASGGDDGTLRIRNIQDHLQMLTRRDMIRVIYFVPRGSTAQQDITPKIDMLIKDVQQFYADQMQAHGFGRKTFTFETGANGMVTIHRVDGRFGDRHYHHNTLHKVEQEIGERFDLSKDIYLVAAEISSERIDNRWCGMGGFDWHGGGNAIIPASGSCPNPGTTAHELGHALGLEHDFRNDAYVMSYGKNPDRFSRCAAEWLNVSRFLNVHDTSFNEPTTIRMLPPMSDPSRGVNLRFEVNDADGLHQSMLIIPTTEDDPAEGVKLYGCKSLIGDVDTAEFLLTEFPGYADYEVTLRVIDVHGNFSQENFSIRADDILTVDVNGDGVVNVTDLVRVAAFFGRTRAPGAALPQDVNRDGVVDVEDILLVIAALEGAADSPAAHPLPVGTNLRDWLARAKQHHMQDPTFKRGILVLEQLLTSIRPTATALLPNYPNPFNPETWIPYHLANAADVQIRIYDTKGIMVRQLDLGHQPIGFYTDRGRAAYWDGRNSSGESVASGTYYLRFSTPLFHQIRRMVILK